MSWFDDLKTPRIKGQAAQRVSKVPEGMWVKCPSCGEILQSQTLQKNLYVCTECQHHLRMTAVDRISILSDPAPKKEKSNSDGASSPFDHLVFEEYGNDLISNDPLEFDDRKPYGDRLKDAAQKTGIGDAFICGKTTLFGLPYHLGVFEFKFMGGSMGAVVGEKVTLLLENGLKDRLPVTVVSASGGARMQEGIISLMQMAKTSGVIQKLRSEGIPFISVLTDPTTGGVAASFAMLGDVILAEPKALVGFAGPRVIEQTIRQSLPEGFQRSEFLKDHGFVDRIVHRNELASELHFWMLKLGQRTCRFPSSVLRGK